MEIRFSTIILRFKNALSVHFFKIITHPVVPEMDGHNHAKLEIRTQLVNWFFMSMTYRPQQFAQSELIMVFHIHFKLCIRDNEDRESSCFQNFGIYPPN